MESRLLSGLPPLADTNIRLGVTSIQTFGWGQLNVSQYITFISSLEVGAKFIAKQNGEPWLDLPPGSATVWLRSGMGSR